MRFQLVLISYGRIGINTAANTAAKSTNIIVSFFMYSFASTSVAINSANSTGILKNKQIKNSYKFVTSNSMSNHVHRLKNFRDYLSRRLTITRNDITKNSVSIFVEIHNVKTKYHNQIKYLQFINLKTLYFHNHLLKKTAIQR
jgi:hypothetical protein